MASVSDIAVSAGFNILSAFVFLLAFALLRIQPFNDRVYFPKWYLRGLRNSPLHTGAFVSKFVNVDFKSYLKFLNWMPDAIKMPESELIEHAGLDSVVYLRIYLIGFWAHLVVEYAITFWSCYVLYKEYAKVTAMRLQFMAAEKRRPDQFTVLVRNIPPDADESISELVEHFFLVNHPDHYLTHQVVHNANKLSDLVEQRKKKQNWLDYYELKFSRKPDQRPMTKTGFLGLFGQKVDAIDYNASEIERLNKEIAEERERVENDAKSIMPAAFVSFKTRWGAAVCAQTHQTRNPTIWLTGWAPEPRDVYWPNLAIPYVHLSIRRLIMSVAFFFLTFFFMIPIALVQSLASIEGIQKYAPFLNFIVERIFEIVGIGIPMKATFFITYIMVDGWAGVAGEILRLKPLIIYHLKNWFLVKTEKDREAAMDAGSIGFNTGEPQIQLYILLAFVYAVVSPIILPFILVFFGFSYLVYRHQIINVYNQEYESAGAFWPAVHGRIITAMVFSQLLLMGLLSTKRAASSTPFLIALPILTIWFHRYCKGRFEPAFKTYPLQEAMMKDTLEHARDPGFNLKAYLQNAYIHPVFKDEGDEDDAVQNKLEMEAELVPTRRQSRRNTPVPSKMSKSSSTSPSKHVDL
uniref:Calcium permeable stress-gated cation channel 1 n=1 Tax=Chenopodium quinoa TaxID=63459 RepID=A0A803M1S7_CHEQI